MANKLINGKLQTTTSHFIELVRKSVPPVHPAANPFIVGALATAALAGRCPLLRKLSLGAAVAFAGFFRNPPRVTPVGFALVTAVADGEICTVDEATPPPEAGFEPNTKCRRVSTFLSIVDVHVQRAPVSGRVTVSEHVAGTFLSADLPEASETNERNTIVIETPSGNKIVSVQVAGMVARRIICDAAVDDALTAGEVYGLIRFGSRVDLYLPLDADIAVLPGQRAVGGETVIARLS
ncbi:MAG: phosphatidylserine decarboxylase [Propionibacteriaceae bacterium]|jgi:phosphatidylserine decarboxylase|nr:phosphatidylserine decarboxylase [Propionibacteriaceae bacterium]